MKRKFGIFLAAILFATQMLSFAHMAEHAFAQHEHKGQVCEVGIYFNQSKSFDDNFKPVIISFAPESSVLAPYFVSDEKFSTFFGHTHHSRAPPSILQA